MRNSFYILALLNFGFNLFHVSLGQVDECAFIRTGSAECVGGGGINCDMLQYCNETGKECVDEEFGWRCGCAAGFRPVVGDAYQFISLICQDYDECSSREHNCEPGLECIDLTPTAENPAGYSCGCPETGNFLRVDGNGNEICEDINECERDVNPCDGVSNTFCRNIPGSYVCDCNEYYASAYIPSANTQCDDINECGTSSCMENSYCQNRVNGFYCQCDEGYERLSNGTCRDDDECSLNTHNCMAEEGKICVNTVGSFTCECMSGTTENGNMCDDINECNSSSCDGNATSCNNTVGSYHCICPDGYDSVGNNCILNDECTLNCTAPHVCLRNGSSSFCGCPDGFEVDTLICSDINECEPDDPCDNENTRCDNNDGGYDCVCVDGFERDEDDVCVQIDFCAEHSCDDENGFCINEPDGAHCHCHLGFERNTDVVGHYCVDVNECYPENQCWSDDNHAAMCVNAIGFYNCKCPKGFYGNGYNNDTFFINGTMCTDIDECMEGYCLFDNALGNGCDNSPGSYDCGCLPGFERNPISHMCEDIDECEDDSSCGTLDCFNNVGNFSCGCPDNHTKFDGRCFRDGGLSDWKKYKRCSAPCDEGSQEFRRMCNNPERELPHGEVCPNVPLTSKSEDCFHFSCEDVELVEKDAMCEMVDEIETEEGAYELIHEYEEDLHHDDLIEYTKEWRNGSISHLCGDGIVKQVQSLQELYHELIEASKKVNYARMDLREIIHCNSAFPVKNDLFGMYRRIVEHMIPLRLVTEYIGQQLIKARAKMLSCDIGDDFKMPIFDLYRHID